jgi:hypothetical protein
MLRKNIAIKKMRVSPSNSYFVWIEFLKAVPWASIWNVVLAIGGLILLMFFLSIGFLPDLDLKGVTTLVAAVAVVGLLLVAYLGYVLWFPSFMYGALTSMEVRKLTTKRILLESVSGTLITMFIVLILNGNDGFNLGTTLLRTSGCFLALMLVVYLIWSWSRQHLIDEIAVISVSKDFQGDPEIKFSANPLAAIKQFVLGKLRPVEKQLSVVKLMASSLARILGWFAWTIIPTLLFIGMAKPKTGYLGGLFDLFLLLLVLIVPVVAGLAIREQIGQKVIAGFCLGVMFLFGIYLNRPFFISEIVMEFFGLTSRESVVMALDEQGCAAVNAQVKHTPCKFEAVSKLGKLNDARLVSRVGLQTVLEFAPESRPLLGDKAIRTRVILKSTSLISWSYSNRDPMSGAKTP